MPFFDTMTDEQCKIRTFNAIRMKNMRKQRGLTQAQMAEKVGMPSKHSVSDLEDEYTNRYNRDHIHKMAKFLDVQLVYDRGWLRIYPDGSYADSATHEDEATYRQARNALAFRQLRAERGLSPRQMEMQSKACYQQWVHEPRNSGRTEEERERYMASYKAPISSRTIKLCETSAPHQENTKALHTLAEFYDVMLHREDDGLWVDRDGKYRDGVNRYDYASIRYRNVGAMKQARKRLGWTLDELARQSGLSKDRVVRLSAYGDQTPDTLQKLAAPLGLAIVDTVNGLMLVDERRWEAHKNAD